MSNFHLSLPAVFLFNKSGPYHHLYENTPKLDTFTIFSLLHFQWVLGQSIDISPKLRHLNVSTGAFPNKEQPGAQGTGVRSRYYGEKKSSLATAQQGVRTLNRYGNHKCLMNPVSTVVWFSPGVRLTREYSTEVLRWCMTHGT